MNTFKKQKREKELVSLLKSFNDYFKNYSLQAADQSLGSHYDALKNSFTYNENKVKKDRKLIKT